jgi:hypothetical protein
MGKKAQDTKNYSVPRDFFVQKLRNIESAGLNLALKSENPVAGGVWFRIHHGMTMRSYGEKITVTLTDVNGGTRVDILSECGMPTQIIDYGKNASNVKVIFRYLENGLPAANAQTRTAAPEQPAAQPKFCFICGKALQPGMRFCPHCGTKLG